MDAEQYLFQNISEVHNLCILLKCLTIVLVLFDIKFTNGYFWLFLKMATKH